MVDPLTEVVALLQPQPLHAKVVSGVGTWRIRRTEIGLPYFCVVVAGSCCLEADGIDTITLCEGDFVLIPSANGFAMSSPDAIGAEELNMTPVELADGEFWLGSQDEPVDTQLLVGHCVFDSPDAALLVSLLPRLVHIRGEQRLSMIVRLLVDETRSRRPGREVVLARLLEILLLEALRSTNRPAPGLLAGLADDRLAIAIREMHHAPDRGWTVERLAKVSALSRSGFYDRFSRTVGIAPMEYLFTLRMALARKLLRGGEANVAEVAERVGYGSASAFSVAFTRHIGIPPGRFAREWMGPPPAGA